MTLRDPLQIKVPTSLTRLEKRVFRKLSGQIDGSKPGVGDLLADYVRLRSRIEDLTVQRAAGIKAASSFTVDKARLLQIGRDLNSSVALSLKLADRLGI